MSRTLTIVKPNATRRNVTGEILAMFEKGGLKIRALRAMSLTKAQAEQFYLVHKERPFYGELVEFMTSGPVVAVVLEGDNAVPTCRKIMGATNPDDADEGTIRKCFGENIQNNAVHGSDSDENAAIEMSFFFSNADLVG